jgi:RNA polymerase sigma factor (sigma-70 family)
MAAAELIGRARSGDGEAFAELVDPYRRELQVHCYRILGSVQDAEDALQETLLAAWQGLDLYAERASIRTWLYRVATSRCLNALRSARRRPALAWPLPGVTLPEPTRLGEVPWLEPYPDALLEGLADAAPGPETRYEATEAISLAFITALQLLPPRQRAVLVLRDVLGFRARETAGILDTSEESVSSAPGPPWRASSRRLGSGNLPRCPARPASRSSSRGSPAPMRPVMSTPLSRCSPTMCCWRCRRSRWSTTGAILPPGSTRQWRSGRAAPTGSSLPAPTASPRSARTCGLRRPGSRARTA